VAPADAGGYQPRNAESTVLHRVLRDNLETFLEHMAARTGGATLPAFVERGMRGFLRCGVLAGGFARFRCEGCAHDRLVPLSCKARGICPSCDGRRMVERAAHLVDAVLPPVPMRQWVLTFPQRVRYLLAWDHQLCCAVLGVFVRAVMSHQRRRAKQQGVASGRSGAVTVIQRFASGLRLNVHLHTLLPDGVFYETMPARSAFTSFRRRATTTSRSSLPPCAGASFDCSNAVATNCRGASTTVQTMTTATMATILLRSPNPPSPCSSALPYAAASRSVHTQAPWWRA
jgi:hypothetical protein